VNSSAPNKVEVRAGPLSAPVTAVREAVLWHGSAELCSHVSRVETDILRSVLDGLATLSEFDAIRRISFCGEKLRATLYHTWGDDGSLVRRSTHVPGIAAAWWKTPSRDLHGDAGGSYGRAETDTRWLCSHVFSPATIEVAS